MLHRWIGLGWIRARCNFVLDAVIREVRFPGARRRFGIVILTERVMMCNMDALG